MARKRMFNKDIVGSDAFLDMPDSSQLLYFHLGMEADDDGFIGNPKKIIRGLGSKEDDLKVLISKRFVITFESGVVVIKHHRINNKWDSHNCKRTAYLEEFNRLYIKDNKAYTLDPAQGKPLNSASSLLPVCQQSVEENRIEENRIDNTNTSQESDSAKKVMFGPEDMRMAELLRDLIQQNAPAWKMRGQITKWAEEINKLHRIDERSYQQIEYMIRWVQADSFWKMNILSPTKLREKFNDLVVKIIATKSKQKNIDNQFIG